MNFSTASRPIAVNLLCAILLLASSGCLTSRVKWPRPTYAQPEWTGQELDNAELDRAEATYACAAESERNGAACCVDQYFETAMLTVSSCDVTCSCPRSFELHRSSLTKLVECGHQFARLDPRSGLIIMRHGERTLIPITHNGFVWETADFERLHPVPDYSTSALRNIHRRPGVGVPLLVTSARQHNNKFLNKNLVFPATLLLQDCDSSHNISTTGEHQDSQHYRLELHDPYRVDEVQIDGQAWQIAKDLSSPFAYRLRDYRGNFVTDFLRPAAQEGESRLYTIEPYQEGKVPIVFVHGLLSDPFTWVEMVNELYSTKGFVENFQVWIFEYPTGQPFFASAAYLREQLGEARSTFDPAGCDPKLSDIILVGHSMGGLIAKMQVTYSGNQLWGSVARVPLESLNVNPTMKERLSSAFFFDPSTYISRVVFIGTPHRGSSIASRPVGRIASSLVSPPEERQAAHRELMENNPGVFSSEVTKRIPSSVDMLNPNSVLLQTIDKLPVAEDVQLHSVIGDARWTLGYGSSDGVVPVVSARHPKSHTERLVSERHSKLHKHKETIQELITILNEHLRKPRVIAPANDSDPELVSTREQ